MNHHWVTKSVSVINLYKEFGNTKLSDPKTKNSNKKRKFVDSFSRYCRD